MVVIDSYLLGELIKSSLNVGIKYMYYFCTCTCISLYSCIHKTWWACKSKMANWPMCLSPRCNTNDYCFPSIQLLYFPSEFNFPFIQSSTLQDTLWFITKCCDLCFFLQKNFQLWLEVYQRNNFPQFAKFTNSVSSKELHLVYKINITDASLSN